MISAWWLLPAFIVGGVSGVSGALFFASRAIGNGMARIWGW